MKKIIRILLLLAAPFVLFDLVSLWKNRHVDQRNESTFDRFEHKGLYWKNRAFDSFPIANEDGEDYVIRIDGRGFRNEETFSSYDCLLLGDSFTQNINTPYPKTFHAHLNRAGLKTYNSGMSGTGTVSQFCILQELIAEIRPKIIVLNFYLGNDFMENLRFASLSGDQEKQLHEPRVLLKKALNRSATLRLTRDLYRRDAAIDMNYYDRAEILLLSEPSHKGVQQAIADTRTYLGKIQEVAKQYQAKLLVVGTPSKAMVEKDASEIELFHDDFYAQEFLNQHVKTLRFERGDEILASLCSELNIEYLSLIETLRSEPNLFYPKDKHWNWRGQKLGAETVLQALHWKTT